MVDYPWIFITFVAISILLIVKSNATFIIEFHSSGLWSKDEVVEYLGKISVLNDFTSCHWQKDNYFASDSSPIWSYCFLELKTDQNWKFGSAAAKSGAHDL